MKFFLASIIGLLLFTPLFSFAAPGDTFDDGGRDEVFDDGGLDETFDRGNSVKLSNPLGDIDSFPELIKAVLDGAFIIGLPVAVLFIVIAGFRFVWARGNPTELEKAKRNLLYTVVGIAVFFGAWLITEVIVGTLARLNIDI